MLSRKFKNGFIHPFQPFSSRPTISSTVSYFGFTHLSDSYWSHFFPLNSSHPDLSAGPWQWATLCCQCPALLKVSPVCRFAWRCNSRIPGLNSLTLEVWKYVKVKESKPLQGKEMRGPLGSNKQKINNQTLQKTDSSIIVTQACKDRSYDPLVYAVCKHRDAVISFVFILRPQKSCDL